MSSTAISGNSHGGDHWVSQRTSAISNFALMIWLVISLVRLPDYDHATLVNWLRSPLAAVPMALLIVSVVTHIRQGLQVVVEDYVHDEGLKFAAITLIKFYAIGVGATALFALAKIAFVGAA